MINIAKLAQDINGYDPTEHSMVDTTETLEVLTNVERKPQGVNEWVKRILKNERFHSVATNQVEHTVVVDPLLDDPYMSMIRNLYITTQGCNPMRYLVDQRKENTKMWRGIEQTMENL